VSGDAVQAIVRVDQVSRLTDEQLLGGLFQKQGLTPNKASDALKNTLEEKFKTARDKYFTGADAAILKKFEQHLAEFRNRK
jgi:hypothetical protein